MARPLGPGGPVHSGPGGPTLRHAFVQENLNLPLLKEEPNGAYYANARTTSSWCSLRVWGKDRCIEWYTYISPVLEKTSLFVYTIIMDCLGTKANPDNCHTIVFWSDGAPSFKSYHLLGLLAGGLQTHLKRHMEYNYGCEMEFKNACDRYFGTQDRVLQEARRETRILTMQDAAQALHKHHNEREDRAP